MSEPGDIVWTPDPARIDSSALARFALLHGFMPEDFAGLHRWSVADPSAFYAALWDFLDLIGERGDRAVEPGADLRGTRFFPDARLSYAENILANADGRPAIIVHRDDGVRRELSRAQLRDLVSRCVQALRAEGIGPGDRVAAIVTNDIEAMALYLACSAIGAVWASCSPDFGPAGASDRLGQIAPSLLVAVPSYQYGGKVHDVRRTIEAVAATPSVRNTILLDEASFSAWLAPFAAAPIEYLRQPFDAPFAILFSSGTTGRPKCIVHSNGGLLLQHRKEQVLHCDLRPEDRLFYFTPCGWIMWNWLVSGLASGATLVTYDGNPFYPDQARLADLVETEGVTIFGTSAKYIDSCLKAGLVPRRTHNLSTLRTVLSTGSPLQPAGFEHIYRDWKPDVHLASISGGTDICGCFLGGVPALPVRAGELQGPMLGMDIAVYDPAGQPIASGTGELVCRNAHPSMPVAFWNDPDGEKYGAAYFERFPGVWAHGDFIERRPSGGYVIHGRSDTTLNPGGVRIGTAEIYRQVEAIPEVLEAAAVGQEVDGDVRIVLFVRLREGLSLTDDLIAAIRARIRSGATPRHVPARIVAVSELPRTRSGKISEIAIRETIHGRPIGNDTALANPECLAAFRNVPALAT